MFVQTHFAIEFRCQPLGVGGGALAHGEEAGGCSGAGVSLALLTLTLLLSCVTAARTGRLTPKPEAALTLLT